MLCSAMPRAHMTAQSPSSFSPRLASFEHVCEHRSCATQRVALLLQIHKRLPITYCLSTVSRGTLTKIDSARQMRLSSASGQTERLAKQDSVQASVRESRAGGRLEAGVEPNLSRSPVPGAPSTDLIEPCGLPRARLGRGGAIA
jgi:hypothetical protein